MQRPVFERFHRVRQFFGGFIQRPVFERFCTVGKLFLFFVFFSRWFCADCQFLRDFVHNFY